MPKPRAGALRPLLLLLACAVVPPAPAGATRPAPGDPTPTTDPSPAAPVAVAEFAARRERLAGFMDDGVLLVIGAAEPEEDFRRFAQSTAFRYLTGFNEPGSALLVAKRAGHLTARLFVLPRNPGREVWDGPRFTPDEAERRTGVPTRPLGALLPTLDSLLVSGVLYTTAPLPPRDEPFAILSPEQQVVQRIAALRPDVQLLSLDRELERIRGEKSGSEIDRIRRAVSITALAQREAIGSVRPGLNEFEVQALIEYAFRRNGAERPAFASIVASGPNTVTLHYAADDRFMRAGEMLVMDVGASYDGYAADVTRTVPVSGRYAPEQRAVYEVVLGAQKAAESRARPGATWAELEAAADSVLASGLTGLGLIDSPGATYDCGTAASPRSCPQYRLYYVHALGHGLGLEVHDPEVSYFGPFRVGSTFAIEPGLYLRSDVFDHLPDTPGNRALAFRLRPALARYGTFGVRIEDDYVVTPTGVERLSAGVPREVAEIEALMAGGSAASGTRHAEVVSWYRAIHPE